MPAARNRTARVQQQHHNRGKDKFVGLSAASSNHSTRGTASPTCAASVHASVRSSIAFSRVFAYDGKLTNNISERGAAYSGPLHSSGCHHSPFLQYSLTGLRKLTSLAAHTRASADPCKFAVLRSTLHRDRLLKASSSSIRSHLPFSASLESYQSQHVSRWRFGGLLPVQQSRAVRFVSTATLQNLTYCLLPVKLHVSSVLCAVKPAFLCPLHSSVRPVPIRK